MNITPKKLYLPYLSYRDFYQIHRVFLVQISTCFPCPIPMSKFHRSYNKKVLRIQFYLSCSFGENFNGYLFHMYVWNFEVISSSSFYFALLRSAANNVNRFCYKTRAWFQRFSIIHLWKKTEIKFGIHSQ